MFSPGWHQPIRSEMPEKPAVVSEAARSAPPGDGFFTLGQFRSAEKARAHLHSSYATGIYDLGHLAPA